MILIFLMSLYLGFLSAEPLRDEFKIFLKLDPEEVSIGQKATLTLIAHYPLGYHIEKPPLKANLVDYFGYGLPPFTVTKELVVKETVSHIEIRYTLVPAIAGTFGISFGIVTFTSQENKSVSILSPVKPVTIILGSVDVNYIPPRPPFLLLKPLLPVEIDLTVKQKLMDESDQAGWESFFLLRRLFLYALILVFAAFIIALIAYFLGIRVTKEMIVSKPTLDAILRRLFSEMTVIYNDQKAGKISPEDALVKMQKALIDTCELRLKIPASQMTVEELKNAFLDIPEIGEGARTDLNYFLDLTLGIKFGKKTIEKEESIKMMKKSLNVLENLIT